MAILFGKNPVLELLEAKPNEVEKVNFAKNISREKCKDVVALCKLNGIRFDFVPAEKIESLCKHKNHQGIVAFHSDFRYSTLEEMDFSENSKVVILDRIEDPHNLGAIIRSALASGAEAVVIPERNSAQVTDTTIKVSAGTAINFPVIRVKNISNAIDFLKEKGFWIVGTAAEDSGIDYRSYNYEGKTGVVIGNEGKGMRDLVKKNCDTLVYIPLKNNVESLNASVAAALILFEANKGEYKKK